MKNETGFYMGIAHAVSTASVAKVKRVGAILVKDGNILSFGYNGTPAGFPNGCEGPDKLTLPEVLHAESNAIAKCAQSTQSAKGATLYVTMAPCFECAKLIIQSGIVAVYYEYTYRDPAGLLLLDRAKILHHQIIG